MSIKYSIYIYECFTVIISKTRGRCAIKRSICLTTLVKPHNLTLFVWPISGEDNFYHVAFSNFFAGVLDWPLTFSNKNLIKDKPTLDTFVHEQETCTAVWSIVIGQRRWRHGVHGDVLSLRREKQFFSFVLDTQTERVSPALSHVVVYVILKTVVVAAVNYDNSTAIVFRSGIASRWQPRRLLHQPYGNFQNILIAALYCLHGLLPAPFLLGYSVFDFIFS